MSDSLQLHGQQHARLPCPSLSPGVCSKLMSIETTMLSHHLILSCPLLLLPSVFPASESFLMSQLFSSGGQSIGASASALVLPINIQGWFPLGFSGLISLLSKGLSKVFSSTTLQKHQFSGMQPFLWFSTHLRTWLLEKPWLWLYGPLSAKWSLLFNMLSGLVMGFPSGSDSKESTCNAGDWSSIPELGRSPGEGNSHPLQYFCLENSIGREAWWATLHGVTKSRTCLSNWH